MLLPWIFLAVLCGGGSGGHRVMAFETQTTTYPAMTVTLTATTKTLSATLDMPSTVITVPDATLSIAALVFTQPVLPAVCQGSAGNLCNDIVRLAPEITQIDDSQLSTLFSQIDQLYSTFTPEAPYPGSPERPRDIIARYFDTNDNNQADFVDRVAGQLAPILPTDYATDVLNALAPIPTLQAEASSYVNSARAYYAPYEVRERSIIAQDLSLTGAAPSFVSNAASIAAAATGSAAGNPNASERGASAAMSTGMSSSGTVTASTSASSTKSANAASPTLLDSLLMSACAAAVGILSIANL